MLWVSVFVSSGMKNIADEQRILKNSWDFSDFSLKLQNTFNYTSSWTYLNNLSPTEVLFKRWQYFNDGWFSYIWDLSIDWNIDVDNWFCLSWSEDTITNHIIIKTFVPFEEAWEDMFSDWYDKIFSWNAWVSFKSDALNHTVLNWTNIIVWKWIYWDKFEEWALWKDIFLNNPTWLAYDAPNNRLYISDTLNNRVLYYDIGSQRIYKLLDDSDWLLEPTWLAYDTLNNRLYISNSWRWEILEYSSPSILVNPNLNVKFSLDSTIPNINNFEVEFLTWVLSAQLPNSNWTNNIWNFTFNWINKYIDFSTWSTNKISYYFSDYSSNISDTWDIFMWSCSAWTKYYLNWSTPERETISCITWSTGSTRVDDWNRFNSIDDLDEITISWITPLFSNTWSYFVKLSLFNWVVKVSEKYFSYFVQWDDDLTTPWDNTLIVISTGFNYPTWINVSWANLQINDFIDRKIKTIAIADGSSISDSLLSPFNFWSLDYIPETDYILKTPLKSLAFDYTGNHLTMLLKYYKNYNCYNLDDNAERSYLIKKNF